jgi:hypothetical protein
MVKQSLGLSPIKVRLVTNADFTVSGYHVNGVPQDERTVKQKQKDVKLSKAYTEARMSLTMANYYVMEPHEDQRVIEPITAGGPAEGGGNEAADEELEAQDAEAAAAAAVAVEALEQGEGDDDGDDADASA